MLSNSKVIWFIFKRRGASRLLITFISSSYLFIRTRGSRIIFYSQRQSPFCLRCFFLSLTPLITPCKCCIHFNFEPRSCSFWMQWTKYWWVYNFENNNYVYIPTIIKMIFIFWDQTIPILQIYSIVISK